MVLHTYKDTEMWRVDGDKRRPALKKTGASCADLRQTTLGVDEAARAVLERLAHERPLRQVAKDCTGSGGEIDGRR